MSPVSDGNRSLAAIVCDHVASGQNPILLAVRTAPEDPDDSGWQFLCASNNHESEDRAQVWLLSEILKKSPELTWWVNSPAGTCLRRKDESSPWMVL
jgi:hypothetical protein